MNKRIAESRRKTKETDIYVRVNLDGAGKAAIDTGIPFLDHMLELFAKHGLFDLTIKAKGDLEVDRHHTNEDVGILLGEAFKKALGDKKGIRRFGSASVPMDEAIANVSLDISGRPRLVVHSPQSIVHSPSPSGRLRFASHSSVVRGKDKVGYVLSDAEHFLESFVNTCGVTLHIRIEGGKDLHHILEAVFKGLGVALSMAVERNPRIKGVPSTKGRL